MRKKIIKKAEAIWAMCRKNELYTKEMFIADWVGAMKTIISDKLGEMEREANAYAEVYSITEEELSHKISTLADVRDKLGIK